MDIKDEIEDLKKILDPVVQTGTTTVDTDLPIFEIDLDGTFITVPDIMEEITGFSRDELLLLDLENVVFVGDRSNVVSAVQAINEGSRLVISEVDIFSKRTGSHPVELIMIPRTENGDIVGAWGTIKDIVNRKDMEDRLIAMREVQKVSQHFLEEYISLMAREIRQPLTSILLTLEMCDSGFFGDVNDRQKEKFDQLIELVDRLKSIVNDALAASKDIGKEIQLETKMIPMNQMIQDVICDKEERLKSKELSICCSINDENIKVPADRKMILQVINDLLDNSIELSPEGGEISVELHHRKNELQFSVSDSGEGIPEDEVKTVFNKIHIDENKEEGSFKEGMNLYMARKVIETHNGSIWCESFPGLGSNFIFTLPIKQEDPGEE